MAIWKYVGCKTTNIPKEILKDSSKLDSSNIRQIIESVPIEEGEIEASNTDAVVALLFADSIFPLKIHMLNPKEIHSKKLKKLRNRLRRMIR